MKSYNNIVLLLAAEQNPIISSPWYYRRSKISLHHRPVQSGLEYEDEDYLFFGASGTPDSKEKKLEGVGSLPQREEKKMEGHSTTAYTREKK